MARVPIEAYVEESEFTNDKGDKIKYLSLEIPVTDSSVKRLKCEQFVLQLAKERAEKKESNPFNF